MPYTSASLSAWHAGCPLTPEPAPFPPVFPLPMFQPAQMRHSRTCVLCSRCFLRECRPQDENVLKVGSGHQGPL